MDKQANHFSKLIVLFTMWAFLLFIPYGVVFAGNHVKTLKVGIAPQQKPKKIRHLWKPFVLQLEKDSGLKVELHGSPNIPTFHSRMLAGKFDIVYVNPLSYINAHEKAGFEAIAKEKHKRLYGILVVNKDSDIKTISDLQNSHIVFPKNAFAATVLTQRYLKKSKITFDPTFMHTHDDGYSLVALNKFDAAGGVMRTFNVIPTSVREKLRVLVKFDGVTPHAFAVHPRVSKKNVLALQTALIQLDNSEEGKKVLEKLHFNSLERSQDKDWDDLRSLMDK